MKSLGTMTDRKIKVLLVDQGEDLVNMFKLMLDRTGEFDIMMEADPSRVDEIARAFEPDFVVMDSMMQKNGAVEMVSRMDHEIDSEPYRFPPPVRICFENKEIKDVWGKCCADNLISPIWN